MQKNVTAGRLSFSQDLGAAITGADAAFIAVGTPTRRGDGHADLQYVMAAAVEIAEAANGYLVVVTKSTVPVGTNRQVKQLIRKTNPALDFDVASNPEFLREGAAIEDFMKPDRVMIGVQSERAAEVMAEIYRPLYLRDFPIITTDLESAEMAKYAANAFLATKISFINEIAALCEKVGADVKQVAKGMGMDNRIGSKFLHAGPGYGGSCFPKDTKALARIGQENAVAMQITETVIKVNEEVKRRMIQKLLDLCDGSFNDKIIAAVQSGIPLSIMYLGMCVATSAICQPQTKNPKVRKIKLLFSRASLYNPGFAMARSSKALADFQLGNIDESEKELKKLIRRYPTFADARAALTALNWSKGESGKAESNWIAVTELDPRYSDEEWLKKIRRWPPQPIRDLMNFIDLK